MCRCRLSEVFLLKHDPKLCSQFTKECLCLGVPSQIQCMLPPLHHWLRCLVFTYLIAKDYYRLLEFLNDTLGHMQPDIFNIGTFKMLNQSFETLKPEVLKATSFRRWNETVFQKVLIAIGYWKSFLKLSI